MTDHAAALAALRVEAADPSLRYPNPAAEQADDITWRAHLTAPVATPTLGWVRADVSHLEREPHRLRIVDAATEELVAYVRHDDHPPEAVLAALADGRLQPYEHVISGAQWHRESHDFPFVSRRPQRNRWPIEWRPIRKTKHHPAGVISDQVWTPAYGSVVARIAVSWTSYEDDFEFEAWITRPGGYLLGDVSHVDYHIDGLPAAVAVASSELVLRRLARDDIDAMVSDAEHPHKHAEASGVYRLDV